MENSSLRYNNRVSEYNRPEPFSDGVSFPYDRVGELEIAERSGQKQDVTHVGKKVKFKTILSLVAPWFVILILIYIAFFTHPGTLGKTVSTPPISKLDRFYGITRVNGHVLWLVGNLGKIVKSTDGGQNWVVQPTQSSTNLQSIAAWNSSNAVAVGDHSTVLVTQDGGKTWSSAKSIPHSRTFNKLINVRVLTKGQAWAVGEQGAILRSVDQGRTWKRMRAKEDVTIHDITGIGRKLWAVGEFGTILFSSNDGTTWSKLKSGTNSILNAVHFRDADHGVVVGLDGVILTTSDGGKSWLKANLPNSDHFFAVSWNGSRWLATGGKGIVASSGPAGKKWRRTRLSAKNFSWHTSIAPAERGWLLAGSSVGLYAKGKWKKVSSDSKERPHG